MYKNVIKTLLIFFYKRIQYYHDEIFRFQISITGNFFFLTFKHDECKMQNVLQQLFPGFDPGKLGYFVVFQ